MFGITINEVLSFIGASTLVSLLFTQIIKGTVTTEFSKKLETYKQELNKDMESLKHQQNKMYKDFELFAVKKHEHYPELYKLIELCIGKVSSLRGYTRQLDFQNLNAEDISRFMTEKDFTSEDKASILKAWENHRKQAIDSLIYRLKRIEYNEAEETFREAHNFHLLNALYFSENIVNTASELLGNVHSLWVNYDPNFSGVSDSDFMERSRQENEAYLNNIEELRKELKDQMRRELSSNL